VLEVPDRYRCFVPVPPDRPLISRAIVQGSFCSQAAKFGLLPARASISAPSVGLNGEILATQLPGGLLRFVTNSIGARAFGFFITTEDGSHPNNRIISGGGDEGIPTADYSLDRLPPAHAEHDAAIADFTRRLLRAGCPGLTAIWGSPAAPMRSAPWSPAPIRARAWSTRTARCTAALGRALMVRSPAGHALPITELQRR
jgi:hypothetical protein